jgi:hypothetical protein
MIIIVRYDALCPECQFLGIPAEEAEGGGLRLALEANELCSACAQDDLVFVRFPHQHEYDSGLVKRAEEQSSWCRAERWRRRWARVKWWFLTALERFSRWNNYGRKAMLPRDGYTRCTGCGYNYLPEDLDPISGDGEMCEPCFERYITPPAKREGPHSAECKWCDKEEYHP